jgi:hypothetical protein
MAAPGPVSPPSDADQVRYAFRLGWSIAELRGRYTPGGPNPLPPGIPADMTRAQHALVLASERSPRERQIELRMTVEGLCGALGLNNDPDLAAKLTELTTRTTPEHADWNALSNALYELDAALQDSLLVPSTQAAGYQLGRGLAETYWAQEPNRTANETGSWEWLFSDERKATIERYAHRVSPYTGPAVLAAITGPLPAWQKLAHEPDRRAATEVQTRLYEQCLLWKDLITGESQPADLPNKATAHDVWNELGLYKEVWQALRTPLIAAAISVLLLAGGGAALASAATNKALSTAVSIFGAIGLTSASLYARAKAQFTSISTTIHQALELQKVRRAANKCPEPTP